MTNYMDIFNPQNNNTSDEEILTQCNACLDTFSTAFNTCNCAGMDACLHFPHILLSGSRLIIWEYPGQLDDNFFEDLKRSGWTYTIQDVRKPLLICPDKVHLLVHYTRRRADNSIITSHENIWILTRVNNKWGIVLRSY
jgi:hypothetical protein